jgi:4a-hydroxytetrahydrobiopterin dehydratase
MQLSEKRCVVCGSGVPKLDHSQVQTMLEQLNGWSIVDSGKLIKSFSFSDFMSPMDLANKIAAIAEQENHHPDLVIRWGSLTVTIWTHAAGGLTENDFILAAKIDKLDAG